MKEKIQIIILIIIFVIMLISIKILINYESKNTITEKNDINYQYETNNKILEGEENMKNNVLELTGEKFEEEVLKSDKKVLVDFYADWCGPCKMLSPIVEEVAKNNANVKVVRVNVDNAQDLAVEYGVMSIPTLVVIKDGEEVNRSVGLISQKQIEELIK